MPLANDNTSPIPRQVHQHRGACASIIAAALLSLTMPALASRECEQAFYAPIEGACARLPTAELFYYDSGPVKSRQGTVVFLHAASSNADAFRGNFDKFRAAGYRVIAYDRKNVGRSSNTLRDDSLQRSRGTTVQDLEDLANYLGLQRFHLVGVAAGAQVAIQYAAGQYGGRVQNLVLAATLGTPGLSNNEPTLAALEAAIALPFEVFCPMSIANPPPAPLRLVASTTASTVQVPEQLTEHRELGTRFRATNPAGIQAFRTMNDNSRHRSFDGCRYTNVGANQPTPAASDPLNPNTFAKIAALVQTRTLLLAGTGDVFFSPPVHMQLWGAYIHDVQYTQLDTGHAPQLEDPEGFNAALLRFLAGGHPFEWLAKKP